MNVLQHVYFTIMTAYMNGLQKPITCPIQDLTRPHATWNFKATMACSNSQIDGSRKAARLNMPVNSECSFKYTCQFDAPNIVRKSTMVCGKNGKWVGELPDCTDTDELADAIIDVFDHVVPERTEPSVATPTAVEQEVSTPAETLVTTSSAKKNKPKPKSKQIKRLCDSQKMCSKLRSAKDCPKIVPANILNSKNKKFSQRLFKIFTGLCYYCFTNYCSRSVTLL